MAIQGFGSRLTEKIFLGEMDKEVSRLPSDIIRAAQRKLDMLQAAEVLQDLACPPGNNLHALKDDLVGYHAIRINKQWRIIFVWKADGPCEVEIQDYR